jgi:molybdopterin molybdotransferase
LRVAAGACAAPVERVRLAAAVEAFAELTYFLPVRLAWSTEGQVLAEPHPTNTSGDFAALAETDGFVELAPKRGAYPAGTVARLFRW